MKKKKPAKNDTKTFDVLALFQYAVGLVRGKEFVVTIKIPQEL